MTEQEKRYVAEKVLGWDVGKECVWEGDTCTGKRNYWRSQGGSIYRIDTLPDFSEPEYLGPLWNALVEEALSNDVDSIAALGARMFNGSLSGEVSVVNLNTNTTYAHATLPNPNLAIIAAFEALEGK